MSTYKFLPLISQIGTGHGSRTFCTCELKCANRCDHVEPNTTGDGHIQSVLRSAVSRRGVLKVGAAAAADVLFVLTQGQAPKPHPLPPFIGPLFPGASPFIGPFRPRLPRNSSGSARVEPQGLSI